MNKINKNIIFPIEFLQKYDVGKILRNEEHCTVLTCTEIGSQNIFAVKVLSRDAKIEQCFTKEMYEMVKTLNHPNIIKTFDYFEDETTTCLVTEYCVNGDLLDFREENSILEEDVVRNILKQLLKAINYLHDRGLVHQDIKLENIGLDNENDIKLIDFDYCINDADEKKREDLKGTPVYCSPEKIQSLEILESNKPSDIWAAGVSMFVLLFGPFPFEPGKNLYKDIANKVLNYRIICWRDLSEDAIDLVKQMLTRDILKRITIEEALQHRFFSHEEKIVKEVPSPETKI